MSRRGDEAALEMFWITLDFDAGDSTSTLFGEHELKVEETFDDAFVHFSYSPWTFACEFCSAL